MPIRVGWGDREQTYIYVQFIGSWSWDDYYAAHESWNILAERVSHKVATLVNFTDSRSVPQGALTHFRRSFSVENHKRGEFIVVGADTMLYTFGHMLKQMHPELNDLLHAMKTVEEAQQYLESQQA